MQFRIIRIMFCDISWMLLALSVCEIVFSVNANPQLDLPPIKARTNQLNGNNADGRSNIRPNSYAVKIIGNDEDEDRNDERDSNRNDVVLNGHSDSTEYDRDRSLRYGPPYTDGGIRQFQGNRNSNSNKNNNNGDDVVEHHNGDNYPNRSSSNDDYVYRQRYNYNNQNNQNDNDDRYYANRNRYAEDDDKYYAQRDRERDRFNNPNYYHNGVVGGGGGGGIGGGDDDKYYADRNPPYYRNEQEFNRNRYGNGYPNSNYNPNDYERPQYPPSNPYENPYEHDEQARIEEERRLRIEEANLQRILGDVDEKSSLECSLNVNAQWNFETNANELTRQESTVAQQRFSDFQRHLWEQVQTVDRNRVLDDGIYRQLRFLSVIGPNALPPDQLDRYYRIINDMLAIYNKASICAFERPFDCGLKLQPDLKGIMARSRDWDELLYVWGEWRRKSGENMKELYEQLIELTNEAARYNNFSSATEYWTFPFESHNIRQDVENVWTEIMPLYELIHAYVRHKLREFYGPNRINGNAPLPDHVLGNMYGQTWTNILDITIPFPGRSFLDVTPDMLEQGYTPQVMFQLAEEFFLSINMTALPTDFWLDSILERPPPDRQVLCQPSAWDFCDRKTYRIKMCTNVNHKDLITVHHEMAHIQYFINYRHQPKVFRDGANSAFHEAMSAAVALSVSTPKHLQTLGLVQKSVDDTAHDINFLFSLALDKVVFLPFALAMDVWRWDIFNKEIVADQYNCHWWLLRERYGGIKPPVLRSEMDFDPGAKFHIPANIPYIRYFFATILQFQIHRAMCRASNQYDPNNPAKPLHKCDIYRQPIAGNILKQIMEKGASQSWQEILQEVTGEGRLDGTALREFFAPLEEWLRQENLRNNEFVGWNYDGDYCKHSIDTANLQVYGGFYNAAPIKLLNARFTFALAFATYFFVRLSILTH